MDEVITPTPEGAAPTPVADPTPAPARAPDGKFVARETPPPAEAGATTEPTAEPEAPKTEDEPKRSRYQDRIAQLTAEKHAALREAAAARQRYEALQKAPQTQVDPNDYDAQQREGVRKVFREESANQTAAQYDQAVAKAQQAQVETFRAKIDAARERIPDLDRSLQVFYQLPVSDAAAEIIADSEKSAEIAHFLASNPRDAYEIYQMTPAQQGRALARIESQLSIPNRRTSAAPPPPPSVNGSGLARQKTPAEESELEYMARRQKEWAAKRGR